MSAVVRELSPAGAGIAHAQRPAGLPPGPAWAAPTSHQIRPSQRGFALPRAIAEHHETFYLAGVVWWNYALVALD